MGVIGSLGDIIFEVSSDTVKTLSDLSWSGSAKYAVHQRHSGNSLTEFVSVEPDKIAFNISLSAYLGTNPLTDIYKLWKYEREATTLPLVIGNKRFGKYRWSILSHEVKTKHHDGDGNITVASVSLKLQEYLKS